MKELTIKCVDAFTTRSFAGNPAGVIADADGLSPETMQKIASEMLLNIIEIAFVTSTRDKDAICRVHYYTPKTELGCSGHVTIAACYSLIEDGRIPLEDGMTRVQFETAVGNVPIEIHFREGRVTSGTNENVETGVTIDVGSDSYGILEKIMMQQSPHSFRPSTIPVDDIASVLGIDSFEITRTGLPIVVATYDMDWLIIPVKHKETVLEMNPDLIKLGMMNRMHGVNTNHIFTLDTFDPNCTTYARHFGPVMGLWEDPASAMASGGLGAYLLTHGVTNSPSMILEQGKEAESLAKIRVEVEQKDGGIKSVRVGGLASTSITQKIQIENENVLTV